jgi:SSS family solute:Na+ symporter
VGLLGAVLKKVLAEDPTFKRNKDFLRDMFNVAVGICWQIALVALPICTSSSRSSARA